MLLKGTSPAKVLVVSTSPDAVNHNVPIRDALRDGFAEVLGAPPRRPPPATSEEHTAEHHSQQKKAGCRGWG